jgi:hypothetical protein
MAINCLSPISPSAFIRRRAWDEVVVEANTIKASICSTGTSYCHSVVSQQFIDLITRIPLPLIKREEGL